MRTISAILIVLLMGLAAMAVPTLSAVNHPPVAVAGPDKLAGVGETVYFDGSGSSDPDGNSLNYSWDFDDANGITADATGAVSSYTYMDEGTFTVTLTVSDGNLTDTDTAKVTVSQDHQNGAPTAVISEPSNFAIFNNTVNITFAGNGSSDPDGDLLTYKWDFGDSKKANGMIVQHQYVDPGVYTVALNVSDGELNNEATITVLIEGSPTIPGGPPPIPQPNLPGRPTADTGGPYNYPALEEIQLDASGSQSGAAGKLQFCWDLDVRDGIQANFCFDPVAAKENYWQVAYGRDPLVAYQLPGNYTITLIVREEAQYLPSPIYYYKVATTNALIYQHKGVMVDAGKERAIKNGEKTTLNGRVWIEEPKYQDEVVVGCGWDFTNDSTIDYVITFDPSENLKSANCPAVHTYTVNGTKKNDTIFDDRLMGTVNGILHLIPAADPKTPEYLDVPYVFSTNDTSHLTVPAPPNMHPTVTCGPDKTGDNAAFVNEETRFTAVADDPDHDRIILYEWDFDNSGSIDYSNPASGDATYTYQNAGPFTAVVNATDERHGSGMCWVNVTVIQNNAPDAVISAPDSGKASDDIEFDGSGSTDENGAKEIVSYSWDFDAKDGVSSDMTGAVVTHKYTKGGSYTVTLTVKDKHGAEDSETADIRITQTYGVTFENSGASSAEINPGKSQVFTLMLTNTGNGDDTFDLTKTGSKSTWGDLSANEIFLKADETRSVTLRVTVPTSAVALDQATISIDAISQGSSESKDNVQVRITAKQSYGVQAHMEALDAEIKAGETKTVSIRITNQGNGKDTIKFTADGTDKTWIDFKSDSMSMDASETKETTITIIVPKDAKKGDHAITLTAYSTGDNTEKATLTFTVKVKTTTTSNPLPGFDAAFGLLAMAIAFVGIGAWKKRRT